MRKQIERLIEKWTDWAAKDQREWEKLGLQMNLGRALASKQFVRDLKALLREAAREEKDNA